MRRLAFFAAAILVAVVWFAGASAGGERWTFSGVERIDIDGVSGDVIVRPVDGDEVVVELEARVRPADAFRPEVQRDGRTLRIDEDWYGRNTSGSVRWYVYLPDGGDPYRLRFETASGDFDCRNVTVGVRFETASGDIELANVELSDDSRFSTASGDIEVEDMAVGNDAEFSTASGDVYLRNLTIERGCEFSTASGDVEATDCEGYMDLSSASGDVDVRDVVPSGHSEFSSASGDVSVYLKKLPSKGLSASSASGDVLLDVKDFGDDFELEIVKREDRGRIRCPFDYTEESTFRKHGQRYERKTVLRGSGKPRIELRTGSGDVTVAD